MASWAADASRQAVVAAASEVLASVEACVETALKGSKAGVRGG